MSSEGPLKQKNNGREDDPLPDSPEKFRGESSDEEVLSPSKSENIADDDDEI